MNELELFRLESNVRLVLARWLYLLIAIGIVATIIYARNQGMSTFVLPEGPLLIVLGGAAVGNILLLLAAQYTEAQQSVLGGKIMSVVQVVIDLGLILAVLTLVYPTIAVMPTLLLLPILEAVLLFNFFGPIIVALASGVGLVWVVTRTFTIPNPLIIGPELVYSAVYLLVALVFSYHYQYLKLFNIFTTRRKVIKQNLAQDEQLQWVRKYGQKMEENNRKLYTKELELQLAKQELAALDQAKSKFISVTAHQMRTPLSAIKWTFNMLLTGQLGTISEEQKQYINQGSASTEKMITIVNSLLQVDNVETAWANLKPDELHLDTFLDAIISEFTNQVASKKITFKLEKPNRALPVIQADPGKIKMVFENLIDNAIKYTPAGGSVTLKINDININTANPSLEFIITDTGIGIDSADQKKIFGKFFRAGNAVGVEPDGSGVGLYIAKDIIESHQGTIWFESVLGKGTSFHIMLPIRQTMTTGV